MTTTIPGIETSMRAPVETGVRGRVKVIIGGAPVASEYAHQVGADGFAADPASGVRVTEGC